MRSVKNKPQRPWPILSSRLFQPLQDHIPYMYVTPCSRPHTWPSVRPLPLVCSYHQCKREVWGWGVAYQLETWWCRLDVTPPPRSSATTRCSDWKPAPVTIDPPSSDTMLALVAEQIGKMNGATCFPWYWLRGCFLYLECVVVRPKPDGRGSERVNVLAAALHCSVVQSAVCQGLHPCVLEASEA